MAGKPKALVVDEHAARRALDYLLSVRDELVAQDETVTADDQLMLDMLDAEGGDCMDVLRALLAAALDAEAMAEAIERRREDMYVRQQRNENRARRLLNIAAEATRKLGLTRLETEDATLSFRAGGKRIEIESEDMIPRRFLKTTETVDKAALKAFIAEGNTVPGVQIVQGPETHTVRTK